MISKDKITRICLWSGPRNISTTLMYSFAQRADTRVYDEPLYAHYLCNTRAKEYHPGAEEVIDSQENEGKKVVEWMMGEHPQPVVFFKNMTHHLLDLDRTFMKDVVNVILTRDPREMIPSFAEVIEAPTINDIGYAMHTDLVDYFEKQKIPFVVLDSTKVLLNPEKSLQKLSERIGIEYDANMLTWKKGARPEDGVWAKYWYKNIHNSTGFVKYSPKTAPFPEKFKELFDECNIHYQKLLKRAI